MELKVWVEGIQRIVCGVTERTTCQDVVYALAHATGKTGRFTLIERWRNNERLLAPHEHPLKVLMKWGEYSNDVHFVLQRAPLDSSKSENNGSAASTNGTSKSKAIDPLHGFTPPAVDQSTRPLKTNIGIVKGVPQQQQQPSLNSSFDSEKQTYQELSANETKGLVYPKYEPPYGRVYRDSPTNHYSAADSPLVYPRYDPPYGRSSRSPAGGDSPRAPPPYRNPPPPSAVRNQPPPPYREPPRPRGVSPSFTNSSPVQLPQGSGSPIRSQDFARATPPRVSHNGNEYQTGHDYGPRPPSPMTNQQQAQLFQLLNRQREKLDDQHETMSQLDHEIQYFEGLFQEQQNVQKKRKAQQQELAVLEEKFTSYEDELAYLSHLESEWETLCNEESALKDEISSVRSCIAEKDSQIESHMNNLKELREQFKERESRILKDLEEECNRLKAELEAADQRQRELRDEEGRVAEEFSSSCDVLSRKKQDLEELIQEIKEANLQSLSIAPTEDLKNLLEGSHKTGHGRRMLGSPRQLENAVPTSKNPHGVWV